MSERRFAVTLMSQRCDTVRHPRESSPRIKNGAGIHLLGSANADANKNHRQFLSTNHPGSATLVFGREKIAGLSPRHGHAAPGRALIAISENYCPGKP